MTNFFQYLDICAGNLRKLRDPGITPTGMDIELSEDMWIHVYRTIEGQGNNVTARFVKQTFTIENGLNPEHFKIKFMEFTFNVYPYRPRNNARTDFFEL